MHTIFHQIILLKSGKLFLSRLMPTVLVILCTMSQAVAHAPETPALDGQVMNDSAFISFSMQVQQFQKYLTRACHQSTRNCVIPSAR